MKSESFLIEAEKMDRRSHNAESFKLYGSNLQIHHLSVKQMYTLLVVVLVTFLVMLMCGTVGAPSFITTVTTQCANTRNCVEKGIQIC